MVRTIVARVFIAATMLAGAKIATDGYLISYDDDGKTEVSALEQTKRLERKAAQAAETARQLANFEASDKAANDVKQADALAAELPSSKPDAAQAAENARQLAEGRASDKTGRDGLRSELRSARAQLAQTDQERVAVSDALRSTGATAATRQAELLASRHQADALAAELASTKRDAAQAAESARQLAEERAGDKARDGLQADLLASRQQVDALAAELASTKRDAAQAVESARQLAEGRAIDKVVNDGLQAELRAARAQLARADQDRAAASDALHSMQAMATTRQAELLAARQQAATRLIPPIAQLGPKSSSVEATVSSYDDARVILRFRSGSDKARSQATSMKVALADLGFAPISISEDAKAAPSTRVSYYYRQDQSLAEKLADGIKSPLPHRVSFPRHGTPFPGTVEISIGG